MKATVVRIFTFNDNQIKAFMKEQGWDEEDYTDDEVAEALDNAEACELEEYGDCDFFKGHDVEVDE